MLPLPTKTVPAIAYRLVLSHPAEVFASRTANSPFLQDIDEGICGEDNADQQYPPHDPPRRFERGDDCPALFQDDFLSRQKGFHWTTLSFNHPSVPNCWTVQGWFAIEPPFAGRGTEVPLTIGMRRDPAKRGLNSLATGLCRACRNL